MPGDTVIAVGEEENLQKLAKILDPKVKPEPSKGVD